MAYTYDDFVKAANKAGLMNEFSTYDLDIAREHPEFGLSMLTLKQDIHAATTQEAKQLAHETAEQLRSKYGNYSGGANGAGYVVLTPQTQPTAPMYQSSNTMPTYESRYTDQIREAMDKVNSIGAFSYDKNEDPNYSAYRKEYLREGERAEKDTLAKAAAMTGGVPSSYAVTAASQAGDYYASQLSDKLPELYQQAYNRYADEFSRALQKVSMLQGAEEADYNKYLTELNQYNLQEQQDYNRYLAELDQANTERALAADQSATGKALAQGQVDNILMTGNMPSDALLSQAGYTKEYATLMQAYYAQQAAQQASKGGGTGNGTTKPKLTLSQAQKNIANGITNTETMNTLRYYGYSDADIKQMMGVESGSAYNTIRAAIANATGASGTYSAATRSQNYKDALAEIEKALQEKQITEEEAAELRRLANPGTR